ncbi:gamma-glutamyl hydrolase-like [Contarinia nasturtii]|uniref:gamma-glutamyl hydrolase-like n=1 Tax=Contarinia nasturtii TaxID=265458 RepID=UPI0012D4B39C|nr:gamma-glutamyl hydrolase-like [Contarinia nasturtii]XP_031631290.1 gamma-glutamyl hydrolase-like [Contarinia nasturtii]XP_031631291.1 gamma-glutamyl hydrolase-like [Contarinia nasturtii]XP_031631292.1 gamma-glutamyl hydrolase-like [Contarinia nasturtii]XP_031631293.1 gamma-glutamyl hydrolase-like [Contarinia nasturtii]
MTIKKENQQRREIQIKKKEKQRDVQFNFGQLKTLKEKTMARPILCTALLIIAITNYIDIVESSTRHDNLIDRTDRPIIGVLAQEISWKLDAIWPGVYNSYIAASYIKFVEGGGARAVPIWIGKPRSYYEIMLKKLNGVLLPGGGTLFNQSHGYSDAGIHIYDIAKRMNDNGTYLPLFGTCLGFELLLFASNENEEYRTYCSSQRQSLPLNFTKEFKDSRIFGTAPEHIINILKKEPVTSNFHSYCVTPKDMIDYGLDKTWKSLSTNLDENGLEFISSIEHKHYPFYGVQFHPEKNVYEWIRNRNITHTMDSIISSQYFAMFFINECRKNGNHFNGLNEENQALIYNFPVTYTGIQNSTFVQTYLFKCDVDYPDNRKKRNYYNVHLV